MCCLLLRLLLLLSAVLFAVLSVLFEEEDYSLGFNDGYDEAYPDAYEEGYSAAVVASQSTGPVVVAEELHQLAAKSLAQKKEQVLHAIASPVPAAASVV